MPMLVDGASLGSGFLASSGRTRRRLNSRMSSPPFDATIDLAPRASLRALSLLFWLHTAALVLALIALRPGLPMALFAAGAVWAILHPSRSIQDRLAGTWLVPR